MKIKAKWFMPTGFSEPAYYKKECYILDFVVIGNKPHAIVQIEETLSSVSIDELLIDRSQNRWEQKQQKG